MIIIENFVKDIRIIDTNYPLIEVMIENTIIDY